MNELSLFDKIQDFPQNKIMFRNTYFIRSISYDSAMQLIVKHHYLHRKCPCSFSFGLIDSETGKIKGVICYGTPSSAPLRKGICGESEIMNVIELTRLWVSDDVPKNGESFLIGNTLRLVDKEIIVSYAEAEKGHVGTVYQATNFLYTGLSAKRTNWSIPNNKQHSQTVADKFTSKQLKEALGDDFSIVPRERKHRYVFFNCNKYRKKILLQKLKYPLCPYPKLTL